MGVRERRKWVRGKVEWWQISVVKNENASDEMPSQTGKRGIINSLRSIENGIVLKRFLF